MTIQRQYILPNCSLILEGLSADTSNVLSILANAEFKIIGLEYPLAGGSEFFQALVKAVSPYCQRLLSGLNHPDHMTSQSSLVSVEPAEGQYHRLFVKPELLNDPLAVETASIINLSTVQLFDMAEAIDQFCADTQTLPNFSVPLAPLPRKYVRATEPLTKRAVSPLLGFSTLAAAALGLFFLPVPELVESETFDQQNPAALEEQLDNEPGIDPETSDQPLPVSEPEVTEDITSESIESVESVEPIPSDDLVVDSTQLAELQQQVQEQIRGELFADVTFEQPLRYQISVAENGDIVGYNPVDSFSLENIDDTPLPALTYIPVDSNTVEPVAQFDVTFGTDGAIVVVPGPSSSVPATVMPAAITPEVVIPEVVSSEAVIPEAVIPEVVVIPDPVEEEIEEVSGDDIIQQSSTGQEDVDLDDVSISEATTSESDEGLLAAVDIPIQDIDLIYELNQDLRRKIIKNRNPERLGPEISYRVRLDDAGNVIGYKANDVVSEQYAAELKIPNLVKSINTEQPQLDFLVVINDNNIVEVNPWDGWP